MSAGEKNSRFFCSALYSINYEVIYFSLFPAPGHPPVPIEMSNTSSTSLHVTWGVVPPAYHHGEVAGYHIFLEETGNTRVDVANRIFSLGENSTEFTGLKKFTSYTAYVRAYSLFGEGPFDNVIALTDEDGEYHSLTIKFNTLYKQTCKSHI